MNDPVEIRLADPADSQLWDAYVSGHPGRSAYHLYGWRSFFESAMGKRCHYWLAEQDKKIVGILPVAEMRSWLTGRFAVSLPFVNYGGVLADSEMVYRKLFEAAANWAASTPKLSHVELRESVGRPALPVRSDKVSMQLTLPKNQEELGKQLGAKMRSQIKRPQRENPDVRIGGMELLDDFYAVFARNMRDLGTPVYAKGFFEHILRSSVTDSWLVCVYVNGRPAAASFLLSHFQQVLEIPWASAIRDFNRISINMLLYWESLSFAIEKGFSIFDFGRSTKDSGPYRFKKQWGATPVELYWHYWLARGESLPAINPDNPKYRLAIRGWQRLPLAIANLMGPPIVRQLP